MFFLSVVLIFWSLKLAMDIFIAVFEVVSNKLLYL